MGYLAKLSLGGQANDYGWITRNDLERSVTAKDPGSLISFIREHAANRQTPRLLDIGCGYGGLTKIVAEALGANEVHGIDLNATLEQEVRSKGIVFHRLNAESQPLPFADEYFDFAMSLGVLEHLVYVDNLLQEVRRVLRQGGLCLISMPNLANWVNRYALLRGYQPRDVEISKKVVGGIHPMYSKTSGDLTVIGHVHSVTTATFSKLMAFHGFKQVSLDGFRSPVSEHAFPLLFQVLDAILSKRVTLARRFFYLGEKQ